MVKLLAFFKRKPGISVEQFQRHWRTTHADLVVRQRGMRRYVQNHTLASGYRNGEPDYDGVAEAWFDSTQDMRELAPSAAYRAVREDEANFIDASSLGSVITDEVVIIDGPIPTPSVKMISFLKKRHDVSVEFFQSHWRDAHGPIAAQIPGNRRYVQCRARLGIYATGRSPLFDGIPIAWFDDVDALRASGQSPEYAATLADNPNFLAPGRFPFVIAAAHEIEV